MIAATVVLVTLAYLAWRTATVGNGQLLISGILAILALMAFLSIPKLDWQDEQAETYRGIFDDFRKRFPVSIRFSSAHGLPEESSTGVAGSTFPVTVGFAEPEVHRVDNSMLDEAKRLAAQGVPIDDICRMIDRDHDLHDPVHREAFRRIVQAMIEQG